MIEQLVADHLKMRAKSIDVAEPKRGQTVASLVRNSNQRHAMLTCATFGLAYQAMSASEFHRRNIGLTKL
jgi:hypothetical protein